MTAVLLASAFALVVVVGEGVEKVWGLASASVCFVIAFVLPAGCYVRLVAPGSVGMRVLLIVSSLLAVVCTAQNAKHIFGGVGQR